MRAKRTVKAIGPSEKAVRALLDQYDCPVPYHAVRTRFLGALVSPVERVSPLDIVKGLWGGELPTFDSLDAANALLQTLVVGLWNRLARHQKRNEPFRLVRMAVAPTREGLAMLALTRREEIDGFIEGLFGPEESIDLPERGYRALNELGEIRAMLAGMVELAAPPDSEKGLGDAAELIIGINRIAKTAEHELHQAVLSCVRVRRQMSYALPITKPTFH